VIAATAAGYCIRCRPLPFICRPIEQIGMDSLLIYGAYGYTGELIAREAVDRGHEPILAGRDATSVHQLGAELDLRSRSFDLSDQDTIREYLDGVDTILNCAGPFEETADPLIEAAIETQTHYLDITGEIPVFERAARQHEAAETAGVTIMPGVGFDVVPTDCLSAHLHDRLPSATHLSLAISATGGISPGTTKTALRGLGDGGAIREDGQLRAVPAGDRTRTVDFGWGSQTVTAFPWGDISTAYHTTKIPNIHVYMALPKPARLAMRAGNTLGPLLSAGPVQSLLEAVVDRTVSGPTAEERAAAAVTIWGEAWSEETNETAHSLLSTPDPYDVTVAAALAIAARTVAGEAPTGYQTPAGAFGADFVLELDGVSRRDL